MAELVDRSAAMEAGIKPGDVIIAINDAATHNTAQLQGEISKYRPGDKISIKYVRDNKTHSVNVTLRNNQGNTSVTKANDFAALGCAFTALTDEQKREYQLAGGVQVTVGDGKFKAQGMKTGFIITSVNGTRVSSKDDIEKIYNAIMKGSDPDKVMFVSGIYPTGKRDHFAVTLTDE